MHEVSFRGMPEQGGSLWAVLGAIAAVLGLVHLQPAVWGRGAVPTDPVGTLSLMPL